MSKRWRNTRGDKYQYRIGNVFKTKKEANAKLKLIKKLLKERESCSLKNK
jgi:hypothetical protein